MRLIARVPHTNPAHVARVYRDADWNQFVVRFYVDGKHLVLADGFTDDKVDAMATAAAEFPQSRRAA